MSERLISDEPAQAFDLGLCRSCRSKDTTSGRSLTLRFRMLGPLRVRADAGWSPMASKQQRVVLAVLLADAGRPVSTDRLVDELWGEHPPQRAVNAVHVNVLRLRRLLGDGSIVTVGRGYQLVVGRNDIDATVFLRLVDSARRDLDAGRTEAGAARLARALALWHGPALADVPSSSALAAWMAHMEQLRLAAQEDHHAALLDLGRHRDTVDELDRLVVEHPLREQRWALLIEALHGCGRRAEALEAYQRARAVLSEELGLEPGPRL